MKHLSSTKILFLAKHFSQARNITSSQEKWSIVAFSGQAEKAPNREVFGAANHQSSKRYFENFEFIGFPDAIEPPEVIWAMEPYQWLSKLSSAGLYEVCCPSFGLFQTLSDKFGLFAELLRGGHPTLQKFLRQQFSDFDFQFHWSPNSMVNAEIVSDSRGEGGSGIEKGPVRGAKGVLRSSRVCSYEIGAILQSVAFEGGVQHGPVGRTWSGQVNNQFRNECIYYESDLQKRFSFDEIYALQTYIGEYLIRRGFRGAFSTDWLIEEETGQCFLLEVNPRFSSDLCLFDRAFDEKSGNFVPLAALHAAATLNKELETGLTSPRTFEQFGGGEHQAYYPPDGSDEMDLLTVNHPPQELLDRHTNAPIVQGLKPIPRPQSNG